MQSLFETLPSSASPSSAYYDALSHPGMDAQISSKLDMTPPSFVATTSGYGYAQGMPSTNQSAFQHENQSYVMEHYLHQPQHLLAR